MKKFLAMFAVSTFAILGLSNCGGGGDSSGDANGDGIVDISEFENGCGFQFPQATPPITLTKGKQHFNEDSYDLDMDLGEDAVYAIQDRYLRLQNASEVQTRVTYIKLSETSYQLVFAFFSKDADNTLLAQSLGLGDASLSASKITCTIDFAASPAKAEWDIDAQLPEPEEGDDEPVEGTGRGTEWPIIL